ncbi:hypothetical protein F0223_04315 [Vibrio coralliilyticus]|uniref:hypothetical protein n=1 Tax=Vibrio TaxID=662 RepID=UPI00050106CB|nr:MULTISPECIES: hypothetical protein [Vibrio]KFI12891.1 hypothetical protein IX95_08025 [Vibrio sp. B183]NOI17448.1 hypothetical protein [Vibrio coralliilyticus]
MIEVFITLVAYIAGMFTHWLKWKFDEKRIVRREQRELIDKWNKEIEKFDFMPENVPKITGLSWYTSLRPYLSPKLIKRLETNTIDIHIGSTKNSPNPLKVDMLNEVAELQKHLWGK